MSSLAIKFFPKFIKLADRLCSVLKRFGVKPKWQELRGTFRQISVICTHDGNRQLFDNLTDAQLYNNLHYYCIHKSLPLACIISHLSPLDTLPHQSFNIHFNSLLLLTTWSSFHISRSIFSQRSSYLPRALRYPNTFPSLNPWMCVYLYINRSVLQLRPWSICLIHLEAPLLISSCSKLFQFTQCSQRPCLYVALLRCYCWCINFERWVVHL